MPYARKYNYQGIEKLWDNALVILARDIPSELVLLNAESGASALTNFEGYLHDETIEPPSSFVMVRPSDEDVTQEEDSLDEENVLLITIGKVEGEGRTREALTRDVVRLGRAVRNVLWSMTAKTVSGRIGICTGITCTPPSWEVRGGTLRWGQIGELKYRFILGMQLVISYREISNG